MAINHTQSPSQKYPLILHEALIPYILLVIAFTIPTHRRLVSATIIPLLALSYHNLLQTTSPSPPVGFVIGAYVIFHAYYSLDLLVLRDPRREFRRIGAHVVASTSNGSNGKAGAKKGEGESYPVNSLLHRIGWAVSLVANMRGIGWNWMIHPIPPLPADEVASLRLFIRRRVVRLLLIWAWLDATMFWMHHVDREYFLPDGNAYEYPDIVREPVFVGLFSASSKPQVVSVPRGFPEVPSGVVGVGYRLLLHTVRAILQGALIYTAMNGVYTELAVVAASVGCVVGVGVGGRGSLRGRYLDWRSWPDIFGRWREGDWGHGLTGWWGRAWHGLFKYVFTSPSRYITHTFNLPKNSPATIVINLITPFITSAILHFAASYTRSSDGWGSARFFLVQPAGIIIEQAFLYFYHRTTPTSPSAARRWLERWVPYLWTLAWLVMTSGSFFEELRYGGMWGMQPVAVSLWKGVLGVREGWWAWRRDTVVGWREWWVWDRSAGGWGVRV